MCYSTHFNEQEHRNFLAVDEQLGSIAVSVKKEVLPSTPAAFQYRCIVRSAKVCDACGVMHVVDVMCGVGRTGVGELDLHARDVLGHVVQPVSQLISLT